MTRTKLGASRHSKQVLFVTIAALSMACGGIAQAEQIVFTIDPTQSTITWSGTTGESLGAGSIGPNSAGSLTATLSGHFLVDFDPRNGVPSSVTFEPNHGYYKLSSTNSSPLTPSPVNVSGNNGQGFVFDVRDLSFDIFTEGSISGAGGVFPANLTNFLILSGGFFSNAGDEPYAGATNNLDSGTWTLSENNGEWTLHASTFYDYGDSTLELAATTSMVAKAQFSTANLVDEVPTQVGATEPVVVQTLGAESGTPGGVALSFPPLPPDAEGTGVTSVVVQEVPNLTSISQAAIEAAEEIPIFAAALENLELGEPTNLQIWNVHPEGFINGTSATLVFNYDPSLFQGIDQSLLGIWHFNKLTNQWEWGGTVDVDNHTITYTTTSFSEFIAGVNVPEPSTWVLAASGLVGLLFARWRRFSDRK
jgi:hypothetical protein